MSTVDFVVFVVMALSIALSVLRGLVREILTLVAWTGAVFAVLYGLPIIRPIVRGMFANETTADIAGGAFLGILTLVLLSIAAHYIGKAIKKSGLTAVDRGLGAFFGAGRGALLLCLAYIFVQTLWAPDLPDWLKLAKSQPMLAQGADKVRDELPKNVQAMLEQKTEDDTAKVKTEVPPEKPGDTDDQDAGDAKKPAKPPAEGYKPRERSEMDNLIEKSDTLPATNNTTTK
jgi:membrane protein required for colicin V production